MLKGHIDSVTEDSVSGWAYSGAQNITGTQILAFDGDSCIGAGEIGLYRQDLEAAGLGDGRYGFSIMCDPSALMKAERLNVRLLHSDFMLLIKEVQVPRINRQQLERFSPFSAEEVERVAWMSAQGWLTQEQYLFAKSINSKGYYARSFSRNELSSGDIGGALTRLLADSLSVVFRRDYPDSGFSVLSGEDNIRTELNRLVACPLDQQIFAIFAREVQTINVRGWSMGGVSDTLEAVRVSPFQALILHRECLPESVVADLCDVDLVVISN